MRTGRLDTRQPYLFVRRSTAWDISARDQWLTPPFNAVDYDTESGWDTSSGTNHHYNVKKAGLYLVGAHAIIYWPAANEYGFLSVSGPGTGHTVIAGGYYTNGGTMYLSCMGLFYCAVNDDLKSQVETNATPSTQLAIGSHFWCVRVSAP